MRNSKNRNIITIYTNI